MNETIDFDVNALPGAQEAIRNGVQRIAENIRADDSAAKRKLTLTVTIDPDNMAITSKVTVGLPKTPAVTLPGVFGVRENGTIRLEVPEHQEKLFDAEGESSEWDD